MSSTSDNTDALKGGHAPAVKVAGGVRVKTNVKAHEVAQEHAERAKDIHESEEHDKQNPNPNDEVKTVIDGVPAKGNSDFPAQAVKSFHDKPLPSNQPKVHNSAQHKVIQQPSKK
jgi:hypothetical protein